MNFEFQMKICCEVFNKTGMNPDVANPIIAEFRKRLEALKIKDELPTEDLLAGSIRDISNFIFKQVQPNLMVFEWDLKWNVVDLAPKSMVTNRFNNSTKNKCAKVIGALKIEQNGTVAQVVGIDYR